MSFIAGTVALAVVTAMTCALPGVFVVLRRHSMIVEAISHAVFPGIVVGYLLTSDLQSPWLLAGAACSGVIVVLGSEYLSRLGLVSGDAPQGLVFPALFSVGVILISQHLGNLHLGIETVLVGDLNLAALDQFVWGGQEVAPKYLFVMLGMLLLNVVFIAVTYPQLKLSSLDDEYARVLGIRTGVLNTAFMLTVSLTVTAAFHAAGALLVVGLIVAPAATAFLVTKNLPVMIAVTLGIAVCGALVGFWAAYATDTATSAGMAVTYGVIFGLTLLTVQGRRALVRRPSTGASTKEPVKTANI